MDQHEKIPRTSMIKAHWFPWPPASKPNVDKNLKSKMRATD